jgi:hypothetical protein
VRLIGSFREVSVRVGTAETVMCEYGLGDVVTLGIQHRGGAPLIGFSLWGRPLPSGVPTPAPILLQSAAFATASIWVLDCKGSDPTTLGPGGWTLLTINKAVLGEIEFRARCAVGYADLVLEAGSYE